MIQTPTRSEPEVQPENPGGDRIALAARWRQSDPRGGSRRDRALEDLRNVEKSAAPRAIALDLRGIGLAGEDLSGLELSGCDLSGADLRGADLTGSRLVSAVLRETVLAEARLTECEFLQADLRKCDLSECRAERAGFGGADLSQACLFHAELERASFTRARLCGADLRTAKLRHARLVEADLSAADCSRADLREADLEHCDVSEVSFLEADLRQARLRGLRGHMTTNWIGANVLGADFCGACMVQRTINDQNYLFEFRRQSRFNGMLYWVWWITSDCGRSFLRWGLWTAFLVCVFAGLYQVVEVDYGEHATFISPLYYSVVTLTTLGYGDVLPASPLAQVMAMVEVSLGYVMLGGLLSIFSNKMARRAD
ncbi:MAG: hypothetical protein GY716_08550 [bacterium]|nr:hypothetical protein [bacterium]